MLPYDLALALAVRLANMMKKLFGCGADLVMGNL